MKSRIFTIPCAVLTAGMMLNGLTAHAQAVQVDEAIPSYTRAGGVSGSLDSIGSNPNRERAHRLHCCSRTMECKENLMSDNEQPAVGSVLWRDLTVPDAESLQKFYQKVVGWKTDLVSMGDYNDFSMLAANGDCVGGICHERGNNEGIPGQWLVYVKVADLDKSIEASTALGGKVVHGPRRMGENRFCVIQDPAGAVIGLIA